MYKIDKNVIVYRENGEILLINMKTNKFFALDEISTYVWERIAKVGKVDDIIHDLGRRFPEAKHEIQRDVDLFISSLVSEKIINKRGRIL